MLSDKLNDIRNNMTELKNERKSELNSELKYEIRNKLKNNLNTLNMFRAIRCMSFNVRLDTPADKLNSWPYRKELAASMLQFHHVDIAGLQEVLINQLNDLSKFLPEYGWIGAGRDDGAEKGEFTPIFYLRERLELMGHGTFWLSETPEKPGSRGWDAICRRTVTWGEFKDRLTDKVFYYFNTHFDHFGRVARVQSAYLLLQKIISIACSNPVIVTGDFNCTINSEAYQLLAGKIHNRFGLEPLRDSRYESERGHHGPSITFHDFKATSIFKLAKKLKDLRKAPASIEWEMGIDFIFVKNSVKVIQHGVLSDTWNGRYPSDHMPVVADLILGN
ncbi:MAG TPA: endonuclease/exonuclease/phosphatase family protein [Clostridiales bacterium]|nr:endonuclease/exonuclease/phosphatase family protein [Clostridiales bacterium]